MCTSIADDSLTLCNLSHRFSLGLSCKSLLFGQLYNDSNIPSAPLRAVCHLNTFESKAASHTSRVVRALLAGVCTWLYYAKWLYTHYLSNCCKLFIKSVSHLNTPYYHRLNSLF